MKKLSEKLNDEIVRKRVELLKVKNGVAVVTGGASGLGEATVRKLAAQGAKVAILDLDKEKGNRLAEELGIENVICIQADVTDEKSVQHALEQVMQKFNYIHMLVNCAGIGVARKILGSKGPHDLASFSKVIHVNLIGTFNMIRLVAEKMAFNEPNDVGERGVIVNTASIAAFDGQIGQVAYSASKGGIVGMTLPLARELASFQIRVMTIAPGVFDTPILALLPDEAKNALGKMTPFPPRLGNPNEFAQMVESIVENPMLNGETIRLDGAIRMQA